MTSSFSNGILNASGEVNKTTGVSGTDKFLARVIEKSAGADNQWRFHASSETFVQVRASHLFKLMCVIMLAVVISSIVFYSRIRELEKERESMFQELGNVQMQVQLLLQRMEDVANIAIPSRSERKHLSGKGSEVKKLVKRSASPVQNEGRMHQVGTDENYISNQTTTTYATDLDEWVVSRGSKSKKKESRAVYLQIDGSSVNIRKARRKANEHTKLIGPWYFPDLGDDIGFSDLWYSHLALDTNGTSVIFKEGGLYMISAQVFYQLQLSHASKPTPMGYRVHLKKYGNDTRTFRRPLTIAECVPSFPSTVYQTCFTQVAWYVGEKDEIFLEHFTDSRPMIEALRSGQTFLSIVKL